MKNAVLFASVLLAGCTSIESLRPDIAARGAPSRLDEIAYINTLREAFDFSDVPASGCYAGSDLRYFRPTLEQGYAEHNEEQETALVGRCVRYRRLADQDREAELHRYLEAGFGLTNLYCGRYFTIATESSRKRHLQRNVGATGDALVNAVLGIASAGETALGVANAGFEAFDSTYQNIEDAFLVAPELENVEKLVLAAQQELRATRLAPENMPASYEHARSVIGDYARFCTYTGMKELVNRSITSQTEELIEEAESDGEEAAETEADDGAEAEDGGDR